MKIIDLLLENQNKIYNFFSSLENVPEHYWTQCPPDIKKYLKYLSTYQDYSDLCRFRYIQIKDPGQNKFSKELLIPDLIELFEHENILNVHYFEVWGDILEHIDSPGTLLGYKNDSYDTLIMAVQVPSDDPKIFSTYYNKQLYKLKEGIFETWHVLDCSHGWIFDYEKCNKFFKWLRIDYVEPFEPEVNDYVRWTKGVEGWVYFKDDEYITIEISVRPKDCLNYQACCLHRNERLLVLCYYSQWKELEYVKSRKSIYEEEDIMEMVG